MAHVNELLPSLSTTTTPAGRTRSEKSSDALPSNDRDFINRLFAQLQAIFPAWRAAFPDEAAVAEAKRQWTAGLVQNGMTDIDAIKGGLRVARRSESPFLPSVGQFVAWCKRAKTEALQIPSRVEVESQILAYSSGAKGADQIHPLTYWVRQNMDYYRWRRGPSEKTDRLLDDAYSRALQLAIAGFEFPSAPVLIAEQAGPAKQPTQEMRQQAEQARAAALALFRISPEESAQ